MKEILWPTTFYFFIISFVGGYLISIIFALCGARGTQRVDLKFLFYGFTLGPILEEIIFRGPVYLLVLLSAPSWLCWTVISIWSSFLFGLVHLVNFADTSKKSWLTEPNARKAVSAVVSTIFGGIILGWSVLTTHSLIPAIIVHSGVNLIGLVILYRRTKRAERESIIFYPSRRY